MHNSEIETSFSFIKSEEDKAIEDEERKIKIKELAHLINSIKESDKDGEVKKNRYRREVDAIKDLEVLEAKFFGEEDAAACNI